MNWDNDLEGYWLREEQGNGDDPPGLVSDQSEDDQRPNDDLSSASSDMPFLEPDDADQGDDDDSVESLEEGELDTSRPTYLEVASIHQTTSERNAMQIDPALYWAAKLYIHHHDLLDEQSCEFTAPESFRARYWSIIDQSLPRILFWTRHYGLPVNCAVGPTKRKWEVVRDYVVTRYYIALQVHQSIDNVHIQWDPLSLTFVMPVVI